MELTQTTGVELWIVVGLAGWAIMMTGMWLAAMIDDGKARQDEMVIRELARAENGHYRDQRDRYKGELERAICDKFNQEQTIKRLEADKQVLAREYLKATNEYAWYRSLVRAHDSEAHLAAQAEMICRRESRVGCVKEAMEKADCPLAELEDGGKSRLKPAERPAEASGTMEGCGGGGLASSLRWKDGRV